MKAVEEIKGLEPFKEMDGVKDDKNWRWPKDGVFAKAY